MSAILERTRADHVAWCKQRALRLLSTGAAREAVVSIISALGSHPLTDGTSLGDADMTVLGRAALDDDRDAVKRWINDFR